MLGGLIFYHRIVMGRMTQYFPR